MNDYFNYNHKGKDTQNNDEQFKVVNVGEFFDFTVNLNKTKSNKKDKCLNCGWTSEKFLATGFLGCPECYKYLASTISPVIERLFGKTEHSGVNYNVKPQGDIEELKEQPKNAVEQEDYEQAAIIKRQLNSLIGDDYE